MARPLDGIALLAYTQTNAIGSKTHPIHARHGNPGMDMRANKGARSNFSAQTFSER